MITGNVSNRPVKLSEWLSKMHEYFLERKPFVAATIATYRGSTPHTPGAGLLHSTDTTHRAISSDVHYEAILKSAEALLSRPASICIETLPLGKIAGTDNGFCDVIYEYFSADTYPHWLTALRRHQSDGTSCVLLREFNHPDNSQTTINTEVITLPIDPTGSHSQLERFINRTNDCGLYTQAESQVYWRIVQNKDIPLTLIGNHPVAEEIARQVATLPVRLNWLTSVPQAPDIADGNVVIVMTKDHELDFQMCKLALQKNTHFVGCIGSKKKADLFKDQLHQAGIDKEQLGSFHMPVGLPQIKGKQSSVIATSIVAQLLAQHQW